MSFPVSQLFENEIYTFILYLAAILGCVGFAEYLRNQYHWSSENSRKIVHVSVGVLILSSRFVMSSSLPAIFLAGLFILVNIFAVLTGLFQGMHGTSRFSLGTIFYPVSFLLLVLLYWSTSPTVLLISFMILVLADPVASIVGENINNPALFTLWNDTKSLQGSLALGTTIFLITASGLIILPIHPVPLTSVLLISFIVSLLGMVSEAVSWAGSDNLSLPLLSAFILDISLHSSPAERNAILLWTLCALFFAVIAYRMKVLNAGGAAVAFLLGTIVFSIGGLPWMIPMGAFFVLSSLLSKLKSRF